MIRSVLYVAPKADDHWAIVEFYRRHRVLERAATIDGFVSSEIYVPAGGNGPVLVTAVWEDAAAYERWVASPLRTEQAGDLALLVDGAFDAQVRGDVYELALSVGGAGRSEKGFPV